MYSHMCNWVQKNYVDLHAQKLTGMHVHIIINMHSGPLLNPVILTLSQPGVHDLPNLGNVGQSRTWLSEVPDQY